MDFFKGRAPEGAARPRLQAEGVVMQVARAPGRPCAEDIADIAAGRRDRSQSPLAVG